MLADLDVYSGTTFGGVGMLATPSWTAAIREEEGEEF
jgi:hypothetical protein